MAGSARKKVALPELRHGAFLVSRKLSSMRIICHELSCWCVGFMFRVFKSWSGEWNVNLLARILVILGSIISIGFGIWHFYAPTLWRWYSFTDNMQQSWSLLFAQLMRSFPYLWYCSVWWICYWCMATSWTDVQSFWCCLRHVFQKIVETGLYKFIRHPGYLGQLMIFFGISISLSNWLSVLLMMMTVKIGYLYRIHVEERFMPEEMGENYLKYQARTKRIIPLNFRVLILYKVVVFSKCAVYLIYGCADPGNEAIHPPAPTGQCPTFAFDRAFGWWAGEGM